MKWKREFIRSLKLLLGNEMSILFCSQPEVSCMSLNSLAPFSGISFVLRYNHQKSEETIMKKESGKYFGWIAVLGTLLGSVAYGKGCDTHAKQLVRTYPQIKECRNNRIVWSDGTKMLYDDGKNKNFDQALKHADIQDMFRYPYPSGGYVHKGGPKVNFDPGRIRNDAFFRKMYGNNAAQVRRHLRTIPWLSRSTGGKYRVTVTRINGVDRALAAVSRDLDRAVAKNPSLKKYLVPLGGTFKWRKIAGTNRLSVHSFGAAIDINVKHSAYWRWNKGPYRYRNEIPRVIVRIFEKHGFIWGGQWYHYDTMHFEYRPELLGKSAPKGSSHQKPSRKNLHKNGTNNNDMY